MRRSKPTRDSRQSPRTGLRDVNRQAASRQDRPLARGGSPDATPGSGPARDVRTHAHDQAAARLARRPEEIAREQARPHRHRRRRRGRTLGRRGFNVLGARHPAASELPRLPPSPSPTVAPDRAPSAAATRSPRAAPILVSRRWRPRCRVTIPGGLGCRRAAPTSSSRTTTSMQPKARMIGFPVSLPVHQRVDRMQWRDHPGNRLRHHRRMTIWSPPSAPSDRAIVSAPVDDHARRATPAGAITVSRSRRRRLQQRATRGRLRLLGRRREPTAASLPSGARAIDAGVHRRGAVWPDRAHRHRVAAPGHRLPSMRRARAIVESATFGRS